jgi:hypothetical protein
VRLERLAAGHVVAAVAALVLLLVMAMSWYGSREADLARQLTNGVNSLGGEAGQEQQNAKADANRIIARDEKNPWQERATIDRVLLVLLLLSVFLPLVAATYRAAGRRPRPPWTPSAFAALAAVAAALLLAYRIVNQPGNNAVTTVKIGAPLALLMLAIIGLGSAWAFRGEAEWAELRERATDDDAQSEPRASGEPSAG